jgi:hypothetical protein
MKNMRENNPPVQFLSTNRYFWFASCSVALSFMFLACTQNSFKSEKDLYAYLQEESNGLKISKKVNDFTVSFTYKPTDLLVAQQVGSNPTKTETELARKKYSPYYYFVLSLSRGGKEALHQAEGFGEYSEWVQKLSFRVPDFVNLTTSQRDTIPVADFILNRTYGLASATDVLVVFNRVKAKDKEWVQINIADFGMLPGVNRFRFKVKDLENAPCLEF